MRDPERNTLKNKQVDLSPIYTGSRWPNGESVGLETRGNPRLWVRIPAPTGSPRLLPGRCTIGCPLLQVCREHISLLIVLCIIVYVTNKAHPSLICTSASDQRAAICLSKILLSKRYMT